MERPTTNPRAGSMLVEAIVAASLLGLLAGGALMTTRLVNQTYSANYVDSQLQELAAKTADHVVVRLRGADLAGVNPPATVPGTFADSIDFQRASLPGDPPFAPEGFVFESDPGDPDDGMDNDGDGLVDERRLVWVENPGVPGERELLLTSWVAENLEGETPGNLIDDNGNGLVDERGVCFEFQDGYVVFHLTLERFDTEGQRLVHSITRAVALRNTPE